MDFLYLNTGGSHWKEHAWGGSQVGRLKVLCEALFKLKADRQHLFYYEQVWVLPWPVFPKLMCNWVMPNHAFVLLHVWDTG